MSDLHLFRLSDGKPEEIASTTATLERHIQRLFEHNLRELLGVTFLRSEYRTSPDHAGRIDTLGLDENNVPVIIEYKRSKGENALAQVLYYYDWMGNHRAEFAAVARDELDRRANDSGFGDPIELDWSAPRLIIIAGTFEAYDLHAAAHVAPSVELITYRHYGSDMLLLDYAFVPNRGRGRGSSASHWDLADGDAQTAEDRLDTLSDESRELINAIRVCLREMGSDVSEVPLKRYIAFKRLKNFACIVPRQQEALVFLRLDPASVELESGFTRDMRGRGHWGTGDLELSISKSSDLKRALPLFQRAYDLA